LIWGTAEIAEEGSEVVDTCWTGGYERCGLLKSVGEGLSLVERATDGVEVVVGWTTNGREKGGELSIRLAMSGGRKKYGFALTSEASPSSGQGRSSPKRVAGPQLPLSAHIPAPR